MKTEAKIQADLFTWFWNNYPQYRGLLFHVPNGGRRTKREASKFKAMGVVAGVPDLVLAMPNNRYPGMFIEVKEPTRGVTSDEQSEIHKILRLQGYYVVTIDDTDIGKAEIIGYLSDKS